MICEQSGHLTHSPSGTRLSFSFARVTIGLRSFLNHAIGYGSRLSAFGFRLSAFGSRLSALGFRLSALRFRLVGLWLIVCLPRAVLTLGHSSFEPPTVPPIASPCSRSLQ